MISFILWAVLLYFIHLAVPAASRIATIAGGIGNQMSYALGARDNAPEATVLVARAQRAQRNLEESLFLFLPLAFLLLVLKNDTAIASSGASLYLITRAGYLPAYLTGIFGLRTALWAASIVGIIMMAVGLHT